MRNFSFKTIFICLIAVSAAHAEERSVFPLGAFTDFYFANSSDVRGVHDRPYTSQALRTNQISLNLDYVEGKLATAGLHGRLALQTGTAVQANYSSESSGGLAK